MAVCHQHLAAQKELRVLFIGNSLTAANDLPALVRKIGESDGTKVRSRTVAMNDFGLEEHWNEGTAAREIRRREWDFVVLQQGPSSLPASRAILRDYVVRFNALIREAGAQPAVYMVWPSRQRFSDFDRASESYRLAAADIQARLLPAGDAWRAAWARAPETPLYSSDQFHPSKDGSWLAALVVYCGLTGRAPAALKLPRDFPEPHDLFTAAAGTALAATQAEPARAPIRGPN